MKKDLEKNLPYTVHKFGGASLADAERFVSLKSLLTEKNEIIVVSAIKDCTSLLQAMLDAAKNKQDFLGILSDLKNQHVDIIHALLKKNSSQDIILSIERDFSEIQEILHTIQLTHSYSPEIQNLILGYGEIWSGKILAQYLAEHEKVAYLDASTVLIIHEKNGVVAVDWKKSQEKLDRFLDKNIFDKLVVTGFIASTEDGRRTTLGRNGSDFSAAIFARLLKAKSLTIWKDVDGIFTADPKRVRSAFVIDSLSYNEALEFAYFGAKVLHPMTIAPLLKHQIPLRIKNSLNPHAKGTDISAAPSPSIYPIKGLTCIDNITLINIEGTGMIGVSGIAARVFQLLHNVNISVILISQASSEQSICFAVSSQYADLAVKELSDNLQFELDRQQIEAIHVDKTCAILAVVGDNMVGTTGVSGKLFNTLAKANINIHAISQGSSERNISVVIKNREINKALQTVHAGFYLSPKTISIGLIGPGQIGGTLLNQIEASLDALQEKYQVNLCVRGIMNSHNMILSHEAIDLSQWPELLDKSAVKANIDDFVDHIKSNDIPHAVIIDCTANQNIAQYYSDFIEKTIHVITPNKHANSGDLNFYKKLKNIVQAKKCHYLYEATVCAGLPIINTLQDLIKTGDEVNKVEGVVSGTLSFVFNELKKGRLFSEIVLEAKQKGFTEPDPREDLSGMDVARKFVCLAREIGYDVSMKDIQLHNLVPESLRACSVDEFLAKLPEYDKDMTDLMTKASAKKEQLCYAGVIHPNGSIEVDIHSISQQHALSRLNGADNMLIFHTRRYDEQPLVIQGPGAGAEVTAAGIFADLLRLVSFLA